MAGSYVAGEYSNASYTIALINAACAAGDVILINLDGVAISYTVKSSDLGAESEGVIQALVNAINATVSKDSVFAEPINQVFEAYIRNHAFPGVRGFPMVFVQARPQFLKPIQLNATRNNEEVSIIAGTPSAQHITVNEPIDVGLNLVTTINGVAITYTVTAGDTASSIATNIATQIKSTTVTQLGSGVPLNESVTAQTMAAAGQPDVIEVFGSGIAWNQSFNLTVATEKATLNVNGRFLNDRYGNQIILRGLNYQILYGTNYPNADFLDEIAKTNANCIRIQWFVNQPGGGAVPTISELSDFLDRCIALDIIPIVMLAQDGGCPDTSALNSIYVPWWTGEALSMAKSHSGCLIVNIVNELGLYRWADGDQATALANYVSAYKTAIANLRNAGIAAPLMIDAPDCGITLDAFTSIGTELIAADPLQNVLLSTHTYWAGYDGRPYISQAISANLPIVFGEVANKEDINTGDCFYDLDGSKQKNAPPTGFTYQPFLQTLKQDQIGWLAWCWTNDECGPRNLSIDGSFAQLTPWGSDIVNNPDYGLKATAVRIKS